MGMIQKSTPAAKATGPAVPSGGRSASASAQPIKVYMMDLWAYVPYYDGYIARSLRTVGVDVSMGSISYHRDPEYYKRIGLPTDPGCCDVVSGWRIKNPRLRQSLKFVEFCLNAFVLSIRFAFKKPGIVHVQYMPLLQRGLPLEVWFLRYIRWLGIPIVYTVHNVLPQDTGEHFKAIYQRVYPLADLLICHNQAAQKRLVEEFSIAPKRIRVIPHGPMFYDGQRPSLADARAKMNLSPGQCLVLWQGVVVPYKGIDFLLHAWSKVQHDALNARLIIAGTGDSHLLQSIREKVKSLGIEKTVQLELRFLPVDELYTYYTAADIVVYPYKEITTSGALLTGISHAKTIVATDLPPFRELLRDGLSAALVHYGDVESLSATLERLIQDPAERKRLSDGIAASRSTQDPWLPIAQETQKCYLEVLRARSAGA